MHSPRSNSYNQSDDDGDDDGAEDIFDDGAEPDEVKIQPQPV